MDNDGEIISSPKTTKNPAKNQYISEIQGTLKNKPIAKIICTPESQPAAKSQPDANSIYTSKAIAKNQCIQPKKPRYALSAIVNEETYRKSQCAAQAQGLTVSAWLSALIQRELKGN